MRSGIADAAVDTDAPLTLYGETFASRLLLGTARYPSLASLVDAIRAARPAMVTVALRRQLAGAQGADGAQGGEASFFETLRREGRPFLPNTAGCQSVDEAVNTARMAREVFGTDWVKLELIGDDYTLQPDPVALIEAAAILIREGFKVLPYCTEDLVVGRRLLDAGCQALMPWAAPIGTGRGVANPHALRLLRERLPDTPLIVDAGLGVPSHACQVLEWGFDGVLLNTAVSQATSPPRMAAAFAAAVAAGRDARRAGPMPERAAAQASTAVVGMPFWHQAGATS
ncbi:thiazole synthase [Robbsia sp. Bb-Pol-6]|uniref:Thiazole synthase n=1 Tax=Robbsia betulipollinis TaxID=2981849 RepID=A0ABT3ZQX5_9BURK|nr:thiazole synthase [Robbsia betulipollinis]MCY0388340.1 thiazole synthase [Robbsia betulipollinis]